MSHLRNCEAQLTLQHTTTPHFSTMQTPPTKIILPQLPAAPVLSVSPNDHATVVPVLFLPPAVNTTQTLHLLTPSPSLNDKSPSPSSQYRTAVNPVLTLRTGHLRHPPTMDRFLPPKLSTRTSDNPMNVEPKCICISHSDKSCNCKSGEYSC